MFFDSAFAGPRTALRLIRFERIWPVELLVGDCNLYKRRSISPVAARPDLGPWLMMGGFKARVMRGRLRTLARGTWCAYLGPWLMRDDIGGHVRRARVFRGGSPQTQGGTGVCLRSAG